jgi:hypothetical protein
MPAEGVVARFGGEAGRLGWPAHHLPSIGPVEPFTVELRLATAIGPILDGLEEGRYSGQIPNSSQYRSIRASRSNCERRSPSSFVWFSHMPSTASRLASLNRLTIPA